MRTRTNGVTACASCATGSSSGTGSGQVGPSGGRKAQAVPRLSAEQGSFLGCLCPAGQPSARDLGLSRTVYSPAVKADICKPGGREQELCHSSHLPGCPPSPAASLPDAGGSAQHQTSELPVFSLGCQPLSALQILCQKAGNKFIPPKTLLCKAEVS